jgi:hypothetical protein
MPAIYAGTLSKSDVVNLWRKVQGPLRQVVNFMYEEWDLLQDLEDYDVDWSTRSIEAAMDLEEDGNIASIPEFGWEAKPSSPNPVDALFTWVIFNGRFTISKTARWIDEKNKGAMLENQMKYQARKKLEALRRRLAQYFYGTPSAIAARANAGVGPGTSLNIDLVDAHGIADLDDKVFIASLFRKNEWIAVLNPTGPAIRQFGKITAVTIGATFAQISVTFNASVTVSAADYIVFAASLAEDTASLDSCDWAKGLAGWLHILTADTVQNISRTTQPKWDVAYANTTAGRFTGMKLRKMKQAVSNVGGGRITNVLWSQGVENDVTAQLLAGLRFTDSFNMEMDGAPKAKGIRLQSTRSMLPGYVIAYDKSAIRKMTLLPPPNRPTWNDAEKIPDRHGFIVPMDYPCQMVVLNRANLAYESNKVEQ